jgi:hypothetical protein
LRSSAGSLGELSLRFELPGVPPNLLNVRMHWAKLATTKKQWFEATYRAAQLARGGLAKAEPEDRRQVKITLFRVRLLDKDGAEASVKPLIDALKRYQRRKVGGVMVKVDGVGLIYDDDAEHCGWSVEQVQIKHRKEQKTVVRVSV